MHRARWRLVVSGILGLLGLVLASYGTVTCWFFRPMVGSVVEHPPRPLTEDTYVGVLGAEGMMAGAFQVSLWMIALSVLLLVAAVVALGRRPRPASAQSSSPPP